MQERYRRLSRKQFLQALTIVAGTGALIALDRLTHPLPRNPNQTPPSEGVEKIPVVSLEELINQPKKYENQRIITQGYEQMHPEPYESAQMNATPVPRNPNNPKEKYFIIYLLVGVNPQTASIDTREVREIEGDPPFVPESYDTYQEVRVTGRIINSTGDSTHPYYRLERDKTEVLNGVIIPPGDVPDTNCFVISGNLPVKSEEPVTVRLYANGGFLGGGIFSGSVSTEKDGVRFRAPIIRPLKDGKPHEIYAYQQNKDGSLEEQPLPGFPRTITCPPKHK